MKYALILLILFTSAEACSMPHETVVLLHGLARTSHSMNALESALSKEGYQILNIYYPSRKFQIPELAQIVRSEIAGKTVDVEKVHFITHSMGGIIIRYIQKYDPLPNVGRVVMLSPPNHGSEVVDAIGGIWPFGLINGPAGSQLGTDKMSIPQTLGPVNFETGIITGDRSVNWINSIMIPGQDDGKVSIESAKVDGMTDFLIVHCSHPFIMKNEDAIKKCISFLRNGHF
jgi:triacylglycerol lipase